MALATQCPHCGTIFRVASDQLKLRGGIVRCGKCSEVFDGNASLIDVDAIRAGQAPGPDAPAADAPLPATPAEKFDAEIADIEEAAAEQQPAAGIDETPAAEDVEVYTLDFTTTFDPLGILPKVDEAITPVEEAADSEQPAPPVIPSQAGTHTEQAAATESLAPADSVEAPASSAEPPPPDEAPPTADAALPAGDAPPAEDTLHADESLHATDTPGPSAEQPPSPDSPLDVASLPAAAPPPADDAQHVDSDETAPATPAEAPFDIDFDLDLSAPPVMSSQDEPQAPAAGSDDDTTPPAPETETEPSSARELESSATPTAHADTHTPAPLEPDLPALLDHRAQDEEPTPLPASDIASEAELSPIGMPAVADPAAEAPEASDADGAGTETDTDTVHHDPDEPSFVTKSKRKQKTTRVMRIAMSVGSLLLLAGLLAQTVITFGSVLAARYPQAKPTLITACQLFACKITLPAQPDALAVDTGELQTLGNDTFSFSTTLHNTSALAQTWPHIELALTDAADKPVLRRVIKPAEYLPAGTDPNKGFAPHTDQAVKLYFELKDLKASGYHIAVFYP